MANWPSSLPPSPIDDGLSYTPRDGIIRTQMEAGPEKRRRRFTAVGEDVTMRVPVDLAQSQVLDAFFQDELHGGVDEFQWKHFKRAGFPSCYYTFKAPPQYQRIGGNVWIAQLELYRMP